MKKTVIMSMALGLFVAGSVATAQAQVDDHLKCFKAKDGQKFKSATVDLAVDAAFDPPFPDEVGCVIKGKAKKLCVPVTKTVTATDATQVAADGPPLVALYTCYKVKCPAAGPATVSMFDQFGGRDLTKLKADLVCTPTFSGPAPTTTSTTTSTTTTMVTTPLCAPALPTPPCDGDCGGPGTMCADPGGGCMCVASGGPCGTVVGPPTCYGDCFVAGEACVDIGGTCACDEPGAPPACGPGLPAPFCDGSCAPGVMCADPGGGCACVPTAGPCGAVAAFPTCLGDCPAGTSCRGTFPAAPPGCACLP